MRSESSGYGGYAAPSSWVQPVPTVLTSPQGSPQARWEKVGKGGKMQRRWIWKSIFVRRSHRLKFLEFLRWVLRCVSLTKELDISFVFKGVVLCGRKAFGKLNTVCNFLHDLFGVIKFHRSTSRFLLQHTAVSSYVDSNNGEVLAGGGLAFIRQWERALISLDIFSPSKNHTEKWLNCRCCPPSNFL